MKTPVGASGSSVIRSAPRQRTRRLASALHRSFQLLQVVRAGMQFEKGMQLALAFGEFQRLREHVRTRTLVAVLAEARSGSRWASKSSIATKPFFSRERITLRTFGNFFCR